jgi:hypothetical protein
MLFVTDSEKKEEVLSQMDKITRSWEDKAVRGECSWICSDCGMSFNDGMPDVCAYDHQVCTDILSRDKERAKVK